MNICNSIISLFIFFQCSSLLYSQSFEHRKFRYDWKDEVRVKLDQSAKYKDYDAVILHEETTIDVATKNIKRYQVFQFNTQQAIDEYNLFRVPIVMDPHWAALENVFRNDTTGFPKLFYEKINFFDARIIRNGEIKKAVLQELAYRREERTGEFLIPYYIHYFYVRNLEPGDQVEVVISHQWPINTFVYYLNEKLPKQEVFVTVNNEYLSRVNVYHNEAISTLAFVDRSANGLTYKVEYDNLEPVDPNIQTPINELPRVEMYVDEKAERSSQWFGKDIIDTLKWRDVLIKLVKTLNTQETRTWEYYDEQSYKTTLFFENMKKLSGDSLKGAGLMNFIHNYVVDNLEYKNDFNFFIHTEEGMLNMGTFLEKGTLRESARTLFYYNMLDRIDIGYFKAYLQDRRIFSLDSAILTPFSLEHPSYWMMDEDSNLYAYIPKISRSGWYVNEMPFYYTDEYTFLIPQNVPLKIFDLKIPIPYKYIEPVPYQANKKRVKSVVSVSLANKSTTIQSEITLSGQFSTMTRGYYQYGWMDTTISPSYYVDIFKKIGDKEIKLKTAEKTFPFTHSFNIKGSGYKNIVVPVKNGVPIEGSFIIDLSNLINIHYENLETKYFKANFRHDFKGKEEFIIEIDFDQLVSIEDMESYNMEVKGEGFLFSSNFVKVADNQYGLHIIWDIREDITKLQELALLEEAFKKIKELTKMQLKVRIQ